MARTRKIAACLALLAGGALLGTAVADGSGNELITTSLPGVTTAVTIPVITTIAVTTSVPTVTTTVPAATTVPITTTVPQVTTTIPAVTTVRITTTAPKVTTTATATTSPGITTPGVPATTAALSGLPATAPNAVPAPATSVSKPNSPSVAGASGAASPSGAVDVIPGTALFGSAAAGPAPSAPAAADSATLFWQSDARSTTSVARMLIARRFITLAGRPSVRSAVLILELAHGGLVRLTIVQVYPACRRLTTITVHGPRGTNRIRLRPRLRGHSLHPGTYEVGIQNLDGTLKRLRFAVFTSGSPSRAELLTSLKRSACQAPISSSISPGNAAGSSEVQVVNPDGTVNFRLAASVLGATRSASSTEARHRVGVEGAIAHLRPSYLYGSSPSRTLALFALAFAATLFAAAAAPRRVADTPILGGALARHRVELIGAGVCVLVGYLLGAFI
jgi:hypothetical protein